MSVQLALYKACGNWLNRLIRWWTGSQYSYCELVVRGTCYSSVRGGGGSGGFGGGGAGSANASPAVAGTGGSAAVLIFWG